MPLGWSFLCSGFQSAIFSPALMQRSETCFSNVETSFSSGNCCFNSSSLFLSLSFSKCQLRKFFGLRLIFRYLIFLCRYFDFKGLYLFMLWKDEKENDRQLR